MVMGVHPDPISGFDVLNVVLQWLLNASILLCVVKYFIQHLKFGLGKIPRDTKMGKGIMEKIGLGSVKLTQHELAVAANLIDPSDITVTWNNIAGLDDIIQEIRETVMFPIQKRHLIRDTKLIQPPNGVLLHGPPGCGKTMIAKAMAQEAGARFINLDVSTLTDKWYGESQKLAHAVFTLGAKLQPAIIFIDEIDSFLRSRTLHDHETTAMMKAQFLSLWDGLSTDHGNAVVVMGATNRPDDVDKAILRRMPCVFHIGLPNEDQRKCIIQLILVNEPLKEDVDVNLIAKLTEGFSGSDLRELCRNAALYRIKDYMKSERGKAEEKEAEDVQTEKKSEGNELHNVDLHSTVDSKEDLVKNVNAQGDTAEKSTSIQSVIHDGGTIQGDIAQEDTANANVIQGLRLIEMNDFCAALSKVKSSMIPTATKAI